MTQRATGFARRPAGTRAAEKARAVSQPEGEPVPLDLFQLIAPYKRHRGISLRVERLAHGARLSQGRNNGDQSWSLAPDELDGLEYLPATEFYEAHSLSVRIISVDGGDGETLTVVDLPIAAHPPAGSEMETPSASGASAAELQRLREELVKVKTALAARDTELAAARRSSESLERSRLALKAEFTAAEAAWDRELREQLEAASAEAQKNLEKLQAEWEAQQQSARNLRSHSQQSLDEAREHWRQESQALLAKAQAEWKIAEAAHLSAAEASWREQSSKTLSELRARAEQAEGALMRARADIGNANKGDSELRDQLSVLQAQLAARDAEFSQVQREADAARRQAEAAKTEIKRFEQASKAAEAVRIAGIEAHWKEELAKSVAEVNGRLEKSETALAEARAQAEARLHQVKVVQASLATRESELAKARSMVEELRARSSEDAEQSRARWQQEMDAAVAEAQQRFKSGEAARIAAAETQWKAQFAATLAESTAKLDRAESALLQMRCDFDAYRSQAESELRQLRDDAAAAENSLAARDSELSEARIALEQARTTADQSLQSVAAEIEKARKLWKKEADAALRKAEQNWRAEEAPRIAAAEARWREQIAVEIDRANGRAERAEAGIADANLCAEALRHELSAAQSSLATREVELAEARAMLEQERDRIRQVPAGSQEHKARWVEDEEDRRAQFRRRLIRDFAVVACLGVLTFMLFPRVQPVVADAWPQSLSLKSDLAPLLQMAGISASAPLPAPAAAPAKRATVSVRAANLREKPSKGAMVLTRLSRSAEVTPVERRGNWVLVRVGEGANQKQGWVAAAVLKDLTLPGPAKSGALAAAK